MRLVLASSVAALALVGCVDEELGPDGIDDVGATTGKADGAPLSECESRELLAYLNDGTSADALIDAGVHTQAARRLAAHRDGADATFGTTDDNAFDSIEEVDGVPYVGPAAFAQLVAAIEPRCALLTLQGTCTTTTTNFYNNYGSPSSRQSSVTLTVRLDPPTGDATVEPRPITGTVLVESPWGSLPGGVWRAWCNARQGNYDRLTEPCSIGPFEISTKSLGISSSGYSNFMHSSTEGYALSFGGGVEYGRDSYFDPSYTSERYFCSLR